MDSRNDGYDLDSVAFWTWELSKYPESDDDRWDDEEEDE